MCESCCAAVAMNGLLFPAKALNNGKEGPEHTFNIEVRLLLGLSQLSGLLLL